MLIIETRRGSRGKLWIKRGAFLGVAALIAGCWLAYQPALARYHQWKQARALRQAKEFIAKHDAADAQLALQVAFTAGPAGIETWRTAADMLEQAGSTEAVRMRQHILELGGATLADKVALANTAMAFRDYNSARDALAAMTPEEAGRPLALQAALSFALVTENAPVADALLDRLRAANSNSEDLKVAQAILHLHHPRAAVAAAARSTLEQMAPNPKYTLRIHRELAADAIGRRDMPAAEHWAMAAAGDAGANFSDRIRLANFGLLTEHRSFEEVFGQLSRQVPLDAADTGQLADWMLVQGRSAEADRWLGTLPAGLRESPQVRAVAAEAVAQLKDWDRLGKMLEAGAWGPVPPDVVRLAMAAHLMAHREKPTLQEQVWDEAVQASGGNLAGLVALQRLAQLWHWDQELERTLWAIMRSFPDQSWSAQALFNLYHARNDTTNMREALRVMRDNNPQLPRYRHDWALLSLLLNPNSGWDQPKQVLEALYRSSPADAFYLTSYAFALAQAGRGREALTLISQLSAADRNFAPRLPYLAFVYGANRQLAEVDRLSKQAGNSPYLPEEKDLFNQAREAARMTWQQPAKARKPKGPLPRTPAS